MCELILYACPCGDLLDQLTVYLERTSHQIGRNAAHAYMPHCTLTGFFHDQPAKISHYKQALDDALSGMCKGQREPTITIADMILEPDFHYLKIESEWLKSLVQHFVAHADSPTRINALRPKDWLHLSLAYQFPPEQHAALMAIAQAVVDPCAQVEWQLRLYQRHPGNNWQLHQSRLI